MNDPQRLLDGGGGGAEAELLRAARGDAPPSGGKGRLLATMGLVAGVTAASTGTAAGATVAAAGAQGAVVLVGKLVVIGLVGTALAVGTVEMVKPPAQRARVVVPAAAPVSASALAPATAPAPASAPATATATATAPPPAIPPSPRASPPPLTDDDALSAELPFIDLARAAIARGEPADAITSLNTYELRFIHPRLAEEAAVLRIEALGNLGKTAEARAVAARLLHDDPASPYAQRVRSLVHASDNP